MVDSVSFVIIFDQIEEVFAQILVSEHFSHLVHKLIRELLLSKCFVEHVNQYLFLVGVAGEGARRTL